MFAFPSIREFKAAAMENGGEWVSSVVIKDGKTERRLMAFPIPDGEGAHKLGENTLVSWYWAWFGRVDSNVRPAPDQKLTMTRKRTTEVVELTVETVDMKLRGSEGARSGRRATGIMHTKIDRVLNGGAPIKLGRDFHRRVGKATRGVPKANIFIEID